MSVTVTLVHQGVDSYTADVEVTSTETAITITHGLGDDPMYPLELYVFPLKPGCWTKGWQLGGAITATASLAAASSSGGVSGNSLRVLVKRPHTIGR